MDFFVNYTFDKYELPDSQIAVTDVVSNKIEGKTCYNYVEEDEEAEMPEDLLHLSPKQQQSVLEP